MLFERINIVVPARPLTAEAPLSVALGQSLLSHGRDGQWIKTAHHAYIARWDDGESKRTVQIVRYELESGQDLTDAIFAARQMSLPVKGLPVDCSGLLRRLELIGCAFVSPRTIVGLREIFPFVKHVVVHDCPEFDLGWAVGVNPDWTKLGPDESILLAQPTMLGHVSFMINESARTLNSWDGRDMAKTFNPKYLRNTPFSLDAMKKVLRGQGVEKFLHRFIIYTEQGQVGKAMLAIRNGTPYLQEFLCPSCLSNEDDEEDEETCDYDSDPETGDKLPGIFFTNVARLRNKKGGNAGNVGASSCQFSQAVALARRHLAKVHDTDATAPSETEMSIITAARMRPTHKQDLPREAADALMQAVLDSLQLLPEVAEDNQVALSQWDSGLWERQNWQHMPIEQDTQSFAEWVVRLQGLNQPSKMLQKLDTECRCAKGLHVLGDGPSATSSKKPLPTTTAITTTASQPGPEEGITAPPAEARVAPDPLTYATIAAPSTQTTPALPLPGAARAAAPPTAPTQSPTPAPAPAPAPPPFARLLPEHKKAHVLSRMCVRHVNGKGAVWGDRNIDCSVPTCTDFHICKDYWAGIEANGTSGCAHGGDDMVHPDASGNDVFHFKPNCKAYHTSAEEPSFSGAASSTHVSEHDASSPPALTSNLPSSILPEDVGIESEGSSDDEDGGIALTDDDHDYYHGLGHRHHLRAAPVPGHAQQEEQYYVECDRLRYPIAMPAVGEAAHITGPTANWTPPSNAPPSNDSAEFEARNLDDLLERVCLQHINMNGP
ncbi:hypothetical protein LTR65_000939 [Meristemomyces frigidus]